MSLPRPHVSMIVCTRNRREPLEDCLASIERAAKAAPDVDLEIIVVDNGSEDGTGEFLATVAKTSSRPFKAVQEGRTGLSIARNAALRIARGSILAFTDDDCQLSETYFEELVKRYSNDDRPKVRGGRVELGDQGDASITIKLENAAQAYDPRHAPGGFVHGCNMTMHGTVPELIGAFDEDFGAGGALCAAEDTDFVVRAHLAGIPVEYVPDMAVVHHHGRRKRDEIRAVQSAYSFGDGGLIVKYWRKAPWLRRHFAWTFRSALREFGGGPLFNASLRLSHWPLVISGVRGALAYGSRRAARHSAGVFRRIGAPFS